MLSNHYREHIFHNICFRQFEPSQTCPNLNWSLCLVLFLLVVNWPSTNPLGCSRALIISDISTTPVWCLSLSRFLWLCSLLLHGILLDQFHVCLHFKVISRPMGAHLVVPSFKHKLTKISQFSSSFVFWRESVHREHNGT